MIRCAMGRLQVADANRRQQKPKSPAIDRPLMAGEQHRLKPVAKLTAGTRRKAMLEKGNKSI